MTPTLQNRLRNEVWGILPSYADSMFDSIEQAAALLDVVEKDRSSLVSSFESTAIINVSGPMGKRIDFFERFALGMTDYDDIAEAIDQVEASEQFDRLVFHFDTPGGSVMGCPELASRIKAVDLPTVAFTDSLMASAGYWLASQCETVYASPSSSVGSIGVRVMHVDQSGLLEKIGIKVSVFSKGKHKSDFSPFRPLSKDEKEEIQADIDRLHSQFKAAVLSTRSPDESVFESKSYDGSEALQLGLIDGNLDSLPQLLSFLG